MHVNIKTTHVELDPHMGTYLDEKLVVLEKYVDKEDESVKLDFEIEHLKKHKKGDVYKAEINVLVGGKMVRAEAKGTTLQEVIDKVQDESARNLRKLKKKRFSMLKRRGAKMKEMLRFRRR
ncbi:MAG: ribosome-associated translation inhibitor RaiA [Candidatus Pacebacteria bacterium]|jgi:ribosomal subunit interface protein|nr:ribosomal subunit interface protein [bacterium]MDP6527432.1 ribosome-associated translation inhibitor RaiA [Candidatus Paceibacterota bacterium]MDP6659662.1 ribosome-associated translation inhibitor RaiA [Candidatus Paceibacterota bacterium]|tara:strand:+ start:2624 stop:2986 length:363 start_codon:yes stop_codon:yes gene_type:complete